jgi:hypothetical protein
VALALSPSSSNASNLGDNVFAVGLIFSYGELERVLLFAIVVIACDTCDHEYTYNQRSW